MTSQDELRVDGYGAIDGIIEYYEAREREFKDEINWLNAELHGAELEARRVERTCRAVIPDVMEGYVFCSKCGAEIGEYSRPNYCWLCGAKVVE